MRTLGVVGVWPVYVRVLPKICVVDLLHPGTTDNVIAAADNPAQDDSNDDATVSYGNFGNDNSLGVDNDDSGAVVTDKDNVLIVNPILPNIRCAYTRSDPHSAINPVDYMGIKFLIIDNLSTGLLPPGLDSDNSFTVKPPFTE